MDIAESSSIPASRRSLPAAGAAGLSVSAPSVLASRADTSLSGPEAELRRRARARVIAKTVYLAVVAGWVVLGVVQIAIWFLTTPGGYFWPVWPILGTAVAAVAWGIPTFAPFPAISERRIDAEVARLRAQRR